MAQSKRFGKGGKLPLDAKGFLPKEDPEKYKRWANRKEYVCLHAASVGDWFLLGRDVSPRGSRYLKFIRGRTGLVVRLSNHGSGGNAGGHGTFNPQQGYPANIRPSRMEVLSYKNTQFGLQIEAVVQMLAGKKDPSLFESPVSVSENELDEMSKKLRVKASVIR